MPRKRKATSYKEESDDSEYKTSSDSAASEEEEDEDVDDDDDDLTVSSAEKPPAKKKSKPVSPKKPASPKKPPSAKKPTSAKNHPPIYDVNDDEEDHLPTELRKTVAGGYAHTNQSKIKISKANKGNVPWNKGKERSALQRAKIAAGVRARNREALLQKLAVLGLTEDEYEAKQRKVSNLRDKLWKMKKQNKEKAERFTEHITKLEMVEAQRGRKQEAPPEDEETQQQQQQEQARIQKQIQQQEEESEDEDSVDDEESDSDNDAPPVDDRVHPVLAVFTPDIHWTPHTFDPAPKHLKQRLVRYNEICPNGGPGGLICCSTCSATYSGYLSSTLKSMTVQRTSKLAAETEELLGMLNAAKRRLADSVKGARKKPPPVPSMTI